MVSMNTVMASDDTLDIEKVAIHAIKNSQAVQSMDKQVSQAQKDYADMQAMANQLRETLRYQNSYQIVKTIVLLPLECENMLTQVTNGQFVVTNAVRLTVYKAYIDLLKANYNLNIQQDLMNSFAADYKKAKLQQKLGTISQSQLKLREIAYLKAQYAYDSAQKAYDSASMSVNHMMGEELSKRYSTLQDYNITPAAQIKPLNDYVTMALANRADIINAQSTLDIKKKQYEYGKAEVPTDFEFYIQKQEYAIESAQNDLELAKIDVQLDITDLYKTLSSAMKNMEAMKDLREQAAQEYQAAETQYKNSQISLLELNDAKVAKAQADANYKNAELDVWLIQTTMDLSCNIGCRPLSISPISDSF